MIIIIIIISDLEILEIHQKTNNKQDNNTVSDTSRVIKQKQPNRNELPTSENGNATQPSNSKETLSQEQKVNQENLKRIMNGEKNTLPSLRNTEWRTVKTEMNKINQVRPKISTNNITELNELIYAGAKLVCKKIGISSESTKKESKPGWEIRLETQIKKSTKTDQNDKTKERCWNMLEQKGKGNTRKNNSTTWGNKPESIGKEGRLRKYWQRVKQHRQNRTFQNDKRKFYQQLGGDDAITYQ